MKWDETNLYVSIKKAFIKLLQGLLRSFSGLTGASPCLLQTFASIRLIFTLLFSYFESPLAR